MNEKIALQKVVVTSGHHAGRLGVIADRHECGAVDVVLTSVFAREGKMKEVKMILEAGAASARLAGGEYRAA